MIEKLIETIEAEKAGFVKTEGVIRAYRHRMEIELGGSMARRDKEHAENLRNQINECFACEKMMRDRQELAGEMRALIMSEWAPEHLRRGPVN